MVLRGRGQFASHAMAASGLQLLGIQHNNRFDIGSMGGEPHDKPL